MWEEVRTTTQLKRRSACPPGYGTARPRARVQVLRNSEPPRSTADDPVLWRGRYVRFNRFFTLSIERYSL